MDRDIVMRASQTAQGDTDVRKEAGMMGAAVTS